jgi:acyl-homoserine-lactone acylase
VGEVSTGKTIVVSVISNSRKRNFRPPRGYIDQLHCKQKETLMRPLTATVAPLAAAALLAACATGPTGPDARTATIQRTANGVPHISAPDPETLAYAMAYAYAQDNVCMTADQLVTVRGERARWFGGATPGLLARRMFPNEQIDLFIAAHMDDAALERAWMGASAESQAMARGAVAGYNRYLADQAGKLPAACNSQPWVKPMSMAEFRRQGELTAVQAATAALADAVLGAKPPAAAKSSAAPTEPVNLADAADAMREAGLLDSPLGSNAWAFGKDTTANGSGLLLGNPHFPWAGVNRFWQVHLTIPGNLDVMGVGIGSFPGVTIGFNKDVAWSHTVSTGKRFTLHELTLVPGNPTSYLIDGKPEKMTSRTVSVPARAADGSQQTKSATLWSTRWGPVVVLPRAGLNWTASTAYALKDANLGNVRATDAALGFARARNVQERARGHEEHRDALGQHPRCGPKRQHPVRRRFGGARRRCGATAALCAQQARRCAAAGCRPGGAGRLEERLRLAAGPQLAGAGSDSHRPHADRHPDRLGTQQQRRLLLHPPGAEVERHLSAGR